MKAERESPDPRLFGIDLCKFIAAPPPPLVFGALFATPSSVLRCVCSMVISIQLRSRLQIHRFLLSIGIKRKHGAAVSIEIARLIMRENVYFGCTIFFLVVMSRKSSARAFVIQFLLRGGVSDNHQTVCFASTDRSFELAH